MDIKKILNTDYLDILFDGRNKKYGSYQLRKTYNKRIFTGVVIAFSLFIAFFLTTLIKPKTDVVAAPPPIVKDVKLMEPPPIDKKNPPPPPPANIPPPPVKPTVKFTPPVIKEDNEVKEEDKPEPPKPDEHKVVGPKDIKGSDNPDAIDPGLNTNPGNGTGGPVEAPVKPKEEIFRFVDQPASFPGGEGALYKYLSQNVRYPGPAKSRQIQGTVRVQFVVDQNGNISNVEVLKDIGGGCGDEAVRVVKGMPKWAPAKNNGHPVKSYFILPINFTLQ